MKLIDLLNMLRWHKGYDFSKVKIWYINRGSYGNKASIHGNEIESIGEKFLETKSGKFIPLHRIIGIEYEGKKLWAKEF